MKRIPVAIVTSLMFSTGGAWADTISFDLNSPSNNTFWFTAPNYTLFDPSLGTLNSVDLFLTGSINVSAQLQNISSNPQSISLMPSGDVSLMFNDGTPVADLVIQGAQYSQNLPAYDGVNGPSSASYMSVSGLTATSTLDTLLTDPTSLSYFIGTGISNLFVEGNNDTTANSNLLSGTISNQVGGDLQVTYDYTPNSSSSSGTVTTDVVEPRALALFAISLAFLGVARAGSARRGRT